MCLIKHLKDNDNQSDFIYELILVPCFILASEVFSKNGSNVLNLVDNLTLKMPWHTSIYSIVYHVMIYIGYITHDANYNLKCISDYTVDCQFLCCYSETGLERLLSRERDHLSWRTTYEGPKFPCNWPCHQGLPVLRDNIFMANGMVFLDRFRCSNHGNMSSVKPWGLTMTLQSYKWSYSLDFPW